MLAPDDRHALARRRALRAARAVTLGLFALGAGCSATVGPEAPRSPAELADAAPEAATDSTPDVSADAAPDVAVADAATEAAAEDVGERCDRDAGAEEFSACCQRVNWDWNRGCEAWGPFVPPSMEG